MAIRRSLVGIATAVAICSIVNLPVPANASAARTCSSHPNPRDRDSAIGESVSETVPMRYGPHANCSVASYNGAGYLYNYFCFIYNESGNPWTYAEDEFGWRGWVYSPHLENGGSHVPC